MVEDPTGGEVNYKTIKMTKSLIILLLAELIEQLKSDLAEAYAQCDVICHERDYFESLLKQNGIDNPYKYPYGLPSNDYTNSNGE